MLVRLTLLSITNCPSLQEGEVDLLQLFKLIIELLPLSNLLNLSARLYGLDACVFDLYLELLLLGLEGFLHLF